MRGRIYDPMIAQFTSADPITQAPFWSQGLNRYAYAFNDPVNVTDPTGLFGVMPGYPAGIVFTAGGVLMGAASTGFNLGTTLGAMGGPGGIRSIAPSAAPAAAMATQGTMHATTQNKGGVGDAVAPQRPQGGFAPPDLGGTPSADPLRAGDPKGGPGPNLTFDSGAYAYRLSQMALQALQPVFDNFGYDARRVTIAFGSSTSTGRSAAFTVGDSIIINRSAWEARTPLQQRELLAHEITHSVQYARLGKARFLARYGPE